MTAQPTRDQLRALADKATPGPWSYADYGDPNPEHWPVGLIETDGGEEAWTCDTALAMSEPDAKFIAAARTAIPQLLDQLDAAEQRIRDLTQEVKDERGAALDQMEQVRIRDARIKAVRELHVYENRPVEKWARGYRYAGEHCAHDGEHWPCSTTRALEG